MNTLDIPLKAKAVFLSTLPLVNKMTKPCLTLLEHAGVRLDQPAIDYTSLQLTLKALIWCQKFFWKNVIPNENDARLFEATLYSLFEYTFKLDPRPAVQDFINAVKSDHINEAKWFERTIMDHFGQANAATLFEMTIATSEHMEKFFSTWKKIWDMDMKTTRDLVDTLIRKHLDDFGS